YSFFHLLVVGSLIGYVAFTWLLKHVSTTIVSTYSYVNPAVALFVGWLLNGEPITPWILSGMVVILLGVALVRGGVARLNPGERNLRQSAAEKQPTQSWCAGDLRREAAGSTHRAARAARDEIRPAR